MTVTATKCLNGKRHKWTHLWRDQLNELHWCKECGSVTEFCEHNGRRVRCTEDGSRLYIKIPAAADSEQEPK